MINKILVMYGLLCLTTSASSMNQEQYQELDVIKKVVNIVIPNINYEQSLRIHPWYGKTAQGLILGLYCGTPSYLATRWGKISLNAPGSSANAKNCINPGDSFTSKEDETVKIFRGSGVILEPLTLESNKTTRYIVREFQIKGECNRTLLEPIKLEDYSKCDEKILKELEDIINQ